MSGDVPRRTVPLASKRIQTVYLHLHAYIKTRGITFKAPVRVTTAIRMTLPCDTKLRLPRQTRLGDISESVDELRGSGVPTPMEAA